jgi:Holliday junction resolvase
MGNANRLAGDYFEHQTRDALIADGWFIIRAAGSKGPADLVALKASRTPRLVSCKVRPRIGPAERQALLSAAWTAGARPLLAYRPKDGWVALRTVNPGPKGVDIDRLKVPPR